MNDKEIVEASWKLLELARALSTDPAEQSLFCLNANSMIQNSIQADTLRHLITQALVPK